MSGGWQIHHTFTVEIDAVIEAEQVEREVDAEDCRDFVGREILDANDDVAGGLRNSCGRRSQAASAMASNSASEGAWARCHSMPPLIGVRLFIGWIGCGLPRDDDASCRVNTVPVSVARGLSNSRNGCSCSIALSRPTVAASQRMRVTQGPNARSWSMCSAATMSKPALPRTSRHAVRLRQWPWLGSRNFSKAL